MKAMNEIMSLTAGYEYRKNFWQAMRHSPAAMDYIQNALDSDITMYMPEDDEKAFRRKEADSSVIRGLATCLRLYGGESTVWAYEYGNHTKFVGEMEQIPVDDAEDDFVKLKLQRHKVAGITKVSSSFILDSAFDAEAYITGRMARNLAQTEDKAFVDGTGVKEPVGLLHAEKGAQTSSVVESIGYDDCIDLFFSVKPEYRKEGVWLMNDNTALALRKLKDADGNYLWNPANDGILGKRVFICNDLPDIAPGKKPVLFGDMSYYWIIDRSPVGIKPLRELYAVQGKVGYLVQEFLDARLIRPEAVKTIRIKSENDNG